jgi:tRNA G10  N-methylase Trm11
LRAFSRALKEAIQTAGSRVRLVFPSAPRALSRGQGPAYLNAAQIIFNRLTQPPHRELLLVRIGERFYAASTIQVQDISAYAKRDTLRPVRNMRVGMLPPKLAQMMLNLAVGHVPARELTIYDPFCGMGTLVQESYLRGYTTFGSDINPQAIAATQKNLQHSSEDGRAKMPDVFTHDAREAFPERLNGIVDAIVTESHLGQAISGPLPPAQLHRQFEQLGSLYLAFFKNALTTLKPHGVILFTLPMFRAPQGHHTRPLSSIGRDQRVSAAVQGFELFPDSFLDEITRVGYRLLELAPPEIRPFFPKESHTVLPYSRPDSWVGRELILWQKM